MTRANNSGQSLVEFIIVVPLFFIFLSGIISLFYMQNRQYIDIESKISLSLSQFLFKSEERQNAHWDKALIDNNTGLNEELDKSFNPSLGFKYATNKEDGVFYDKKRVTFEGTQNDCEKLNSYSFETDENGAFKISTCADKSGYEKKYFSFTGVLTKFSSFSNEQKSTSLYEPDISFQWDNRLIYPTKSVKEFIMSPSGIYFSYKYAMPLPVAGNINKTFNSDCYMKPFDSSCATKTYEDLIQDAFVAGNKAQLLVCIGESVAKCALAGPGFPVCIIEEMGTLAASLESKQKSPSCRGFSTAFSVYSQAVRAEAAIDVAKTFAQEATMMADFVGGEGPTQ